MNSPGERYKTALGLAGLNQTTAAKLFDQTTRTSNRWAADGAPPWAMVILRLIAEKVVTVERIEEIKAEEAERHA